MDITVALWILVPIALVHLAGRRNRAWLRFQVLVDVALLLLPGRTLVRGLHIGPGLPGAAAWGAPVAVAGSTEQSDLPLEFSAWWGEVRRLAAKGELPWISDRIGGGVPLYANGQTSLPFPLQLPVWFLGPDRGTDVMAVWKLELCALGAFLLLGRLGVRAGPATAGALAFGFGLYQLSWLVVPLSWVVACAPWAWWLLLAALRGDRRQTALLAMLLGVLAGWSVHPETAVFLWFALGAGGVVLAWGRRRRLLRLLVPFALALPIAAVGTIPVLATIAGSSKLAQSRAGQAYPSPGVTCSLRTRMVPLLLTPWREGQPAAGTWGLPFPHAAVAIGVGALPVALLLVNVPLRRRHRRFGLAVAVVGLGAAGLVFQIPGLAQLAARTPVLGVMTWVRAGFLVGFALACLAALTLDGWVRRPRRWRLACSALVVQAGVAALVLTAPGPMPRGARLAAVLPGALAVFAAAPGAAAWGVPMLIGLEAVTLGWDVLPASRPGDPAAAMVRTLRERTEREGGRVLGVGAALPANLAARVGLADLRSADPVRPHALASLHRALGAAGMDLPGPVTTPWAGLAGAWGVRWLVVQDGDPTGRSARDWQEVYRDGTGRLYRNLRALPVLRLATTAVISPGEASAGGWEAVEFASTAVTAESVQVGGDGTLEIVEDRPARHVAHVQVRGRVLAVLHAPQAAGWRVFMDGRQERPVNANLGAMGVIVPEGRHVVRWEYTPPGLPSGIVLTALGLAGCLALALSCQRRRL
jgi:hypothetical protein